MRPLLGYIRDRLKEPSTYGGIVVLLGAVGVKIGPEQAQAVFGALSAIAGAALVFYREREGKK